MTPSVPEFTSQEREILGRHFSNVDEPVFALTNLPDVVKGALFARYSRSPKSLQRLFLDEFYRAGHAPASAGVRAVVTRPHGAPRPSAVVRRRAPGLLAALLSWTPTLGAGAYGNEVAPQRAGTLEPMLLAPITPRQ